MARQIKGTQIKCDLRPAVQRRRWLQKRFCSPWCHPEYSGVQENPHLFYLYVHEINVLYIWYSIHAHWILYMYTGIITCCFSDSVQSQKTLWLHNIQSNVSCACRWPQEQYALPALALILTTLVYIGFKIVETFWNVYCTVEKTGKDLSIDIKAYIKQSNNEGNSWEVFWMHKFCKGKMWVRSHMSIRDYCFIFPRICWHCLFTASQCCWVTWILIALPLYARLLCFPVKKVQNQCEQWVKVGQVSMLLNKYSLESRISFPTSPFVQYLNLETRTWTTASNGKGMRNMEATALGHVHVINPNGFQPV